MDEIIAWTHNRETSGDGTVPVICHATRADLARVQGDPREWHESTDEEYQRFEIYWAKEFPHQPTFIIEEWPYEQRTG